ncbi:hypothetical protein [Chenggangzhangella methanolivorans]|uniref:Uncharacterized protein n=1 Tax=Chenggangzhangella methanolivorans TaxID=1437009 RepID=A0A9E6UJT0_9HYPH|nr:hypothetical protein [Chenggangzhangella methanolivorans]QZN98456.1 hypothetical protein K6K41_15425 [Chenggangzhangella methanolivorans]
MSVESVFRSIAGADWDRTQGGGLSGDEFKAFLGQEAGADSRFNSAEFREASSRLGLSREDSDAVMEAFGKDGELPADRLQELLTRSAGSDGAFNLDELKGGLESLVERAKTRNEEADEAPFAEFGRDAGADEQIDDGEFKAMAEKAGISEEDAGKAFEKAAGADGKLSKEEFEEAFGKGDVSEGQFKKGVDELNGVEEPFAKFAREAGADEQIDESELKATAEKAGISEEDAGKAFEKAAGADGKLSKDEFKEAFGDSQVSEDEFKQGVEDLNSDDEPAASFERDAGADGAIDQAEFTALAERAGLDAEQAEKAFEKIAGADGKISREEFEAEGGLGAGELSKDEFASRVEELAQEDAAG